MRRLAPFASLLCAVAVVACGGGGVSSSSTHSGGPSLAGNSEVEAHRHKEEKQAQDSARQERRKEKENREFKKQEEARIRREEAEREQKEKTEHSHPKSKPETTPEPVPSEVDPIATEEFHQFTGVDHENWELAYEDCGSTPEKQLAREFHTEANWAAIGHAYGSEEFREPFNIAPEEGCMAALKGSKAQWEATLEALPFKEL